MKWLLTVYVYDDVNSLFKHRQFSHGYSKNKVNRPAIKHVYVVVQERALSLRESIFVGDLVGG